MPEMGTPGSVGALGERSPRATRREYVPAPLEETYRITWDDFFPAPMKRLLEAPNPESA